MGKKRISSGCMSESNVDAANHEEKKDDTLLKEIVSRLSEKTRNKLKCASKLDKSTIFDKSFRRGLLLNASGVFCQIYHVGDGDQFKLVEGVYTRLSNNNPGSGWIPEMSLNFLPCYPHLKIIDSCRGLLLCLSNQDKSDKFYVCNPLRRKWVVLLVRTWDKGVVGNARLAYDPLLSPHFQVLIFPGSEEHFPFVRLELFSSESGKWVKTRLKVSKNWYSWRPLPMCFLDGVMYASASRSHAIAIDVKERVCQGIQLPTNSCFSSTVFLGVSGGYLHCIPHIFSSFQIWVLKDRHKNEWALTHSIKFEDLGEIISLSTCCKANIYHGDRFIPLAIHPVMDLVLLRTHCKLFAYNFVTLRAEAAWGSPYGNFSVHPFTPCINLLDYIW